MQSGCMNSLHVPHVLPDLNLPGTPLLSKGTKQHVIMSLCHQVSFSMKFRCLNRKEWWQIFPLFQQKAKEMLSERWKLHFYVITNHLYNTWCTNIEPLCVSCLVLGLGQKYISYVNAWLGEQFPASASSVTGEEMGGTEDGTEALVRERMLCIWEKSVSHNKMVLRNFKFTRSMFAKTSDILNYHLDTMPVKNVV